MDRRVDFAQDSRRGVTGRSGGRMESYEFWDCYDFWDYHEFHDNVEPRPPSCYTDLGRQACLMAWKT